MDKIFVHIIQRNDLKNINLKLSFLVQKLQHSHKSNQDILSIRIDNNFHQTILEHIVDHIYVSSENVDLQQSQAQLFQQKYPRYQFEENDNIKQLSKIFCDEKSVLIECNEEFKKYSELIKNIEPTTCYLRRQDGLSFLVNIHPLFTTKIIQTIASHLFNYNQNLPIKIIINGRQFQTQELVYPFIHNKSIINCIFYFPEAENGKFIIKEPNSNNIMNHELIKRQDSVHELKKQVANYFNIKIQNLYLSFGSTLLNDKKSLKEYKIADGSVIYAINKDVWKKKQTIIQKKREDQNIYKDIELNHINLQYQDANQNKHTHNHKEKYDQQIAQEKNNTQQTKILNEQNQEEAHHKIINQNSQEIVQAEVKQSQEIVQAEVKQSQEIVQAEVKQRQEIVQAEVKQNNNIVQTEIIINNHKKEIQNQPYHEPFTLPFPSLQPTISNEVLLQFTNLKSNHIAQSTESLDYKNEQQLEKGETNLLQFENKLKNFDNLPISQSIYTKTNKCQQLDKLFEKSNQLQNPFNQNGTNSLQQANNLYSSNRTLSRSQTITPIRTSENSPIEREEDQQLIKQIQQLVNLKIQYDQITYQVKVSKNKKVSEIYQLLSYKLKNIKDRDLFINDKKIQTDDLIQNIATEGILIEARQQSLI